MKQKIKFYWEVLKNAGKAFGEKELMIRGAALSYYTIFSLPPMLLVIMHTTSIFFDPEKIRETIFGQLGDLIGQQSAAELADTVQSIGLFEKEGWALAVGIGGTLFTATTIFASIQSTLNKIFSAEENSKKMPWWSFIKSRLLALALVLSIAFVLIVTLTINAIINGFIDYIQAWAPNLSYLIVGLLSILLPLVIITALFTLIFRVLPDKEVPWKVARRGAIVTALLFFLGKYLISMYIGMSNTGNLYDAAGSVIIVMVWVFYASAIFYFGAQFTAIYQKMRPVNTPTEHQAEKSSLIVEH